MEPIIGFPFARTIVAILSRRTVKRTGKETLETRYYLSSQDAEERSHAGWIALTRDHWAGVENRNHWRRDALRQPSSPHDSFLKTKRPGMRLKAPGVVGRAGELPRNLAVDGKTIRRPEPRWP